MLIFVTGATGFIGKHLVPKLQNDGHEVVTNYRYFDERYDAIIHLAAVTHIKTDFDPKIFDANIILADKIFKRREKIIYASSCSAAHLTNPYAYTKRYCEYRGQLHKNAIGLRLHNVYGPGNNKGIVWFLMQQPDGASITIRGPELIRDYIHVDNVVNIIPAFLGNSASHIFDIGTGVGTSTIDLVKLYSNLSGKTFHITTIDAGENEPKKMISSLPVPGAFSLEEGLKKTIQCEQEY